MPFVRRNRFRRGVEQCELHRGQPEAGDYSIEFERLTAFARALKAYLGGVSKSLIHQFRVTLLDVDPTVWRRIQTPAGCSFWALHVAIQDSMGWRDAHMHAFRIKKPRGRKVWEIGLPDEGDDDTLPGWLTAVADYFTEPGTVATYEYDFGDGWRHEVLLEGVLLAEPGVRYPRCLDGERACPPEDSGGPPGYEDLVGIMRDPAHAEHDALATWLARTDAAQQPFDPDRFDVAAIRFDDPRKRLLKMFEQG